MAGRLHRRVDHVQLGDQASDDRLLDRDADLDQDDLDAATAPGRATSPALAATNATFAVLDQLSV